MSLTDLEVPFEEASIRTKEAYQLSPNVKVHSEISSDLDYDHESALVTLLKDCTDEQLISEIARRKLDIQHKVTAELVAKYYHFEKIIGTGASGKVYLVHHRDTNERFACKVIKKDGSMNDAQSMTTEIEIMKRIRHRHIVSLYELFESAQCMWLILELVEGTGLRGVLADMKHYTEVIAARYVKQILLGIHYLHNHGVIHRDMKLDNMLLHGEVSNGQVKIADFGLSALIKRGTKGYHMEESQKRKDFKGLTDMWGTPTHYSPELIQKAYGPQSDIWSLGCMMYEMLTGGEAFPSHDAHDRKDLYNRIKHAKYSKDNLREISSEAQHLISMILEPDPMKRYSASEALAHPWITGEGHFEVHQRHLSSASHSFRLKNNNNNGDVSGTTSAGSSNGNSGNNTSNGNNNNSNGNSNSNINGNSNGSSHHILTNVSSTSNISINFTGNNSLKNSNKNSPKNSSLKSSLKNNNNNSFSGHNINNINFSQTLSTTSTSPERKTTPRKPIRIGLPEISSSSCDSGARKKSSSLSPVSRHSSQTSF